MPCWNWGNSGEGCGLTPKPAGLLELPTTFPYPTDSSPIIHEWSGFNFLSAERAAW
jgi:hypothetical protein